MVENEIEEINEKLDDLYLQRRKEMEDKAILRINSDPSYFYKYQRRFGKVTESVADLKIEKDGN